MRELYDTIGGTQARIWKVFAYLGRYGHQPVNALRGCTVRELMRLADGVSELVTLENGTGSRSNDED